MTASEIDAMTVPVPLVRDEGGVGHEIRTLFPKRRSRGWLVHRLLLAADLLGLTLAFVVAEWLFWYPDDWFEVIAFVATLPVWVVAAKLYGLYDRDEARTSHSTVDDLVRVFHLITVVSWLLVACGWIVGLIDPSLPKVVVFWALGVAFVVSFRAIARVIALRHPLYVQRAIVVGAGDVGQTIARKLLAHPEYGVEVVGFVDDAPKARHAGLGEITVLGSPDQLEELIDRFAIDRVVVAFSNAGHEAHLDLLRRMKERDVHVDVVPRLFEMVGSRAHLHAVEGIPLLGLPPLRLSRSWMFLKRSMDVSLALIGLVALSPLFLAIAILVKTTSRGPILFRQVRMGYQGQPFTILKFRTMVADAEDRKRSVGHLNMHLADDPRMFKIPDDPRTTGVGRHLRRWALDELPQLINVLRGEMSLVGPRPLIPEEDCHVAAWGRRRLDLKPGITGPWQVLGGSRIPFEEMVRLDYLYITNWSLYDDVKWLWRTIPSLVSRRHVY
ncbi:MAG TPA: sugar transferase [Gaiellaceae bacterium]|nr:sugar transferase [Gaiellaceae bacterium]